MISLHTFENTDDNCKLLYKWRTDITCNQNSFTQINNYTNSNLNSLVILLMQSHYILSR